MTTVSSEVLMHHLLRAVPRPRASRFSIRGYSARYICSGPSGRVVILLEEMELWITMRYCADRSTEGLLGIWSWSWRGDEKVGDFSASYLKVVSACCWVLVFECSQWIGSILESRVVLLAIWKARKSDRPFRLSVFAFLAFHHG